MSKPRVLVTRRVPPRVSAAFAEAFDLDLHDSGWPPARVELLARVRGCDGLVTMVSDRVDGELLDAAGDALRVVANYAVGFDNVDVEAAKTRGVVVATTPDVLTDATAELAVGLTLALLRRIAEGDRLLRRGDPWIWGPDFMLGAGLGGKTFGLVGYGRIARRVGELAEAHGATVLHSSSSAGLPLPELLASSDVVSLHVPSNPATRHLIDGAALARMRRGAVLVNTSRGAVVDEAALVRALREGRLAGAALDVFEQEPAVSPELLELENVVLTPHLGSATATAREAMGMLCLEALRAVLLEGRLPANAL